MIDERFIRTQALLGVDAMKKIASSTIMVVGAGAVGGCVIETLARFGVGKIIVIDYDVFDISNINRQILATTSTIGKSKVEVARNRVLDINPNCEVVIKNMFAQSENVEELLSFEPDFVVDAIDSLTAKCTLIEALVKSGVKFISSMGAARKTDPFLIRYGNLSETKNCALARFIRKRLRRRGVDINMVNCVFSTETPADIDIENSDILGSIPTITSMFGLIIANELIKQRLKLQ